MEKYIIDNEIVFSPQERLLLSLKLSSKSTIHNASANCLTLLLENQGEVVSHSELMMAGWGKDAKRTLSNAAYYQCFVNLRKVFRELGYQKEILITARGEGIRFNKYVRVKKQSVSAIPSYCQQKTLIQPTSSTSQNNGRIELQSSEVMQSPVLMENSTDSIMISKSKFHPGVRPWFFVGLFCFILISWLIVRKENDFTLSGYHHIANTPSCFYFNDRNENNSFVTSFLHRNGYVCEDGKKFFVSYFSASPRLTVFICGERVYQKCDSVTYIISSNE
ncbi:winged helix-turn-helix domain-containing protein [Klebsiella oxytoca]|uniref:winged helix-turn-helix domain-containing protein n=1 Tax=Klebsiella oxytoca TaxID=571 RepID=UPI0039C8F03D